MNSDVVIRRGNEEEYTVFYAVSHTIAHWTSASRGLSAQRYSWVFLQRYG